MKITNFNNLTGANVGNMNYTDKAINYKTIDKAVLDGTPHRSDYNFNFNVMTPGEKPIAVSDRWDTMVQDSLGGIDTSLKPYFIHTTYNPSQKMDGATNIEINQFPNGSRFPGDAQYNSHTGLNTPETWRNYIDPAIRNINNTK